MAEQPLLLALDQGTSSSRAALFSSSGDLVISASAPLPISYPADGWVEQDPMAIWTSQRQALVQLDSKLSEPQRKAVVSCGITNQRETTVLWRRSNGLPCGPALVWQDGRTAAICEAWKQQGLEQEWCRRTGLLLDPYFSASKIRWMLDHYQDAQAAAASDDLCFGTVESWLLWQLTGGQRHGSDMSNASRTLLMDLEQQHWVDEFREPTGLPPALYPNCCPAAENSGAWLRTFPLQACRSRPCSATNRPPPWASSVCSPEKASAPTAREPFW